MREANGEGECLGARSLSEDFIEACSDQVRNLWHGVYWTSEVCCKLIPEVAFMNEKGKKKINFPHRLADSQAEVFPRPPTTPPPPPPPLFGMSYLFVFGGSHFSSSPLPGLEVREETNAGGSLGGGLTLPHGCGRLGKPFQAPSAGGRRR